MCGINGFSWNDSLLIRHMNKIISYRGPDDTGIYSDKNITLGHNRLSILDLSKKGHQPMSNINETIWITYNGEIYNYKEIREELISYGYKFISDSDTEVIIYAYEKWGINCINKFNGMFAFGIWDSIKKELILVRDRLGIKPLYYHYQNMNIIFSSEIKALLKHNIERKININSFNSLLTYRFIANHNTIINNINKLLPGHYLIFKKGKITIKKYWDIHWKEENKNINYFENKLDELLNDSVNKRLISDVPLGIFLSGGLDSSLVTAINRKNKEDPIKTFSIGFGHPSDETNYAKKVAEHLNTNHKEIILNFNDLNKNISKIIYYMDEPNTDITMVPLYFLSQVAKKDVTVVNTGEGADELFGGYFHYYLGSNYLKIIPNTIKKKIYQGYYPPFNNNLRKQLLKNTNINDTKLINTLNNKNKLLNNILQFDIKHELPNWQLTRVDRMTMAHAMEARVPFLDYRLVELSSKIPTRFKINGLNGKYILKKVAKKYLPKEIIQRKKQGFTTPMHSWIKDSFGEISENSLLESKIPFINKETIQKIINKHKKIKKQRMFDKTSYQLLILSFFNIWYKIYVEKDQKNLKL